jgi:hypothetical protein
MFLVVAILALLMTGCAVDQPSPRVRTKMITKVIVANCPTDDQLKDAAIAASRATYSKAPRFYTSGSGACPCRDDTYEKKGIKLVCGDQSAEAKTNWVLCRREQVPLALVVEMKAKIPGCAHD